MKLHLMSPVLLAILISQLFSQKIEIMSEKEQMAQQKSKLYSQLRQADIQQTANQELYDVKHYELNLIVDPTRKQLSGSVTILSQVFKQQIQQMDINLLNNMVVDDVKLNGTVLQFEHRSNLVQIKLDKNYQPGEFFKVTIQYHGQPAQSGFGAFGFDTYSGQPMIWSLSEPFGARNWWPCKDIPADKADSADIKVTVPSNLIVASNGNLRAETINGTQKTFWWHESYPITTYLVSVAIHPYRIYSDYYKYSDHDSMEVRFYVFPDRYSVSRQPYSKVVRMIEVFAELFGEYPFIREKYGHAQFMGGANMEHQTLSSMVSLNEYVIAHELAHQWWGDFITCDDFYHIWLNEGFATYSEALYAEKEYGKQAFWDEVNSNKYFGGGTIYVQDLSDIFNYGRSYQKGSWVLHMLRHVVGDENFFKILKAWYQENRLQYSTATTDDFREICERVSGIKLNRFFHQWIYEEYFPVYNYSWKSTPVGDTYKIQLEIQQLQENHIFWMPVDVTIKTADGEETFVAWDSLATQSFEMTTVTAPVKIELDKNNWILKQVQEPLVNPTFTNGILVVNGVSWQTYGTEIRTAYENRAFWGDYPISFWDCFAKPSQGYPSTLPAPIGHGRVLPEILGQFSTIIWVGNDYDGDLTCWKETSILAYLKTGGNVLLLSRRGRNFLTTDLQEYLGITWVENAESQIKNCLPVYTGLQQMNLVGEQTYNAVFSTSFTEKESILLFKETVSFGTPRALGVWRKPADGGTFRSAGGHFAFVSGRPYRYQNNQLKANVEFILANLFGEKLAAVDEFAGELPEKFELLQNHPNPFNPQTEISFTLPAKSPVTLGIYDLLGRKVITLVDQELPAGEHRVKWNATNFSAGIYFYQLQSGNFIQSRKMILLK